MKVSYNAHLMNYVFVFYIAFLCVNQCTCSRWMDARDWLNNREPVLYFDRSTRAIVAKRSSDVLSDFQPEQSIGLNEKLVRGRRSNGQFALSKDETLEATDSEITLEGTEVVRVRERYQGITVYDAVVTVEVDRQDGHLTGQVSGHVLNEIGEDIDNIVPTINETIAVQQIMNFFIATSYSSLHTDLYVYKSPKKTKARLTWRISFFSKVRGVPTRPFCFIDAHTGEIIYCYDALRKLKVKARGGNKNIGELLYGVDMPLLEVKLKKGRCRYKNKDVEVYDYRGKSDNSPEVNIAEFDCKKGMDDTVNGAYSPATDAYFFSSMVVNMFKQWANVGACKLSPIKIHVHEDGEYSAYFDGLVFRFSDGGDYTYPYTTAGIIAHEIGHCFSEHHADFIYRDQSGGVDEAYSDLVGEAVKFFIFGSNDWKSGSDVFKDEGDYVRNMCDQSDDGISITHVSQYKADDKLDVHFLSGIFNKVACTLSKSKGWNMKTIFQVFTHANRFYWHSSAGFDDAACGVIKATYDLGHDFSDVESAFKIVGIKTCNINGYIRQIVANASIPNLKAGIGENIIFKIKTSKISALHHMEIQTSEGIGDVDLYLTREPVFSATNIIKSSLNVGNYETIVVDSGRFDPVYILLKPKIFAFAAITLSVSEK